MELLLFINKMIHKNSQFIIVTHSPILLSFPDADILNFTTTGLKKILYEEIDSYKSIESFINHKESILNNLLTDS
jgi:predicted ATPase